MLRLYNHSRRRRKVRPARSASLCLEELQSRLVLSAAGFAGNDCQPDLDLSGLPSQVVLLGDTLTIDLLAAGATATDSDLTGAPTNDVLRFQLDPDVGTDTPAGAAISDAGVLTWTPTADQLGGQSIMILLLDAGSPVLADAEKLIVTVTDTITNTAPMLDLNGNDAGDGFQTSFISGSGEVSIVGVAEPNALSITDAESSTINSATARFLNVSDAGREFLDVDVNVAATSVNKLYDVTNGVLTLTGSASVADYQAILRTLTYNNSATSVTAGSRDVLITVNDGLDSNTASSTIDVQLAQEPNQAPDLVAIAGHTVTVDKLMEVSVTATDPNSGDTLTFELGTDVISSTPSIERTSNTTAVVRWTPTELDGVGPFTFRVIVTDDGSPALEDEEEFLVSVQFPPSIDLNGDAAGADFATTFSEGDDPTVIVDSGLSVTDLDSGVLDLASATIQNAPDGADEMLSVVTLGTTIVSSYDPTSGELTLSGSDDSPAEFQQVLRTLTYQNLADEPTPGDRSVVVTVSDDDLTSDPATSTVSVVTVNDAPVIDLNGDDGGINSAAAFVEDGGPVNLVTDVLSVTDADNSELTEVTVTITDLADADAEMLEVEIDESTGVTKHYDSAAGRLTLTGTASLATYEAILETLSYDNTSQNPNISDRSVEVRVSDGSLTSEAATVTVSVSGVNDPPILASVDDQQAFLGEELLVHLMATDVDSQNLTYTLNDSIVQSGAMIQISDGDDAFVWTPRVSDGPGTHHVRIDVEDDGDPALMDAVEFEVVVLGARPLLSLNHSGSFGVSGPLKIAIARQLTITDADSPTLTGAAVFINGLVDDPSEFLHIDTTDTADMTYAMITQDYDPDVGLMVLAGENTVANYQKVLQSLEYSNDADNPSFGTRFIEITVTDGVFNSDTISTPVIVRDGNDTLATAEAVEVELGQTLALPTVGIDIGGDVDVFEVDVTAGQTLFADATDPTFASVVRIFDADRLEVSDGSLASTAFAAADEDATYFVGVSANDNTTYDPAITIGRSGSATGLYGLKLSLFESGSGDDTLFLATPQTVGTEVPLFVTDSIDTGSDVDFSAVALDANEVLRVDVILDPDVDVFIRIFDAQGNNIATAGGSVTASLGSAGGTVYVGVSSAELTDYHPLNPAGRAGTSVTDYQIRFQRHVSAPAPPLVDAVMADEEVLAAP